MDADGFTLVLTPAQMAAAISGGTLEGPTSHWTRAWGGAKLLFGALEELGAGALLLAPEPTLATKVGSVALGAHGADTLQSGARQVWTGRETRTLTSEGTAALAAALGVDEATARRVGEDVDLAVPVVLSLGLGAMRVAAVRGGRIVLAEHEAATLRGVGGHTLLRHVAQTDVQLAARVGARPGIATASTFISLAEAERAVSALMRTERAAVTAWARTAGLRATKPFSMAMPRGVGARARSRSLQPGDGSSRKGRLAQGGVERKTLLRSYGVPRGMKNSLPFPRLSTLMGGYLHQDFDLSYEDDVAAISDYARTHQLHEVKQTIEEVDRLLETSSEGLLKRFKDNVSRWDYLIGDNDQEALSWLLKARAIMVAAVEPEASSQAHTGPRRS